MTLLGIQHRNIHLVGFYISYILLEYRKISWMDPDCKILRRILLFSSEYDEQSPVELGVI